MQQQDRFFHQLRATGRKRLPKRFFLFDTETNVNKIPDVGTKQTFRLGWVCCWNTEEKDDSKAVTWQYISKPNVLWSFIDKHMSEKGVNVLCSCNLQFDLAVVDGFAYLAKHQFLTRKFVHIKNGCFLAKFTAGKATLLLCDVLNVLPASVKELGSLLGYAKGDVDFQTATDKELLKYCRRDVEIILKALMENVLFTYNNDLGGWCNTVASQAFHIYRHRFMQSPIWIHNDTEALSLERASYRGGLVAAWRIGTMPKRWYYKLDVNSMYAYVMHKERYPVKYVNTLTGVTKRELRKLLQQYAVVAEVVLNTKTPIYGVRVDKKLLCPVRRFGCVLTAPEIKRALKDGDIVRIGRVSLYEQDVLFRSYVTTFSQMRRKYIQQGNLLYSKICKLLLNGLYGKFAQLREVWETIPPQSLPCEGIHIKWDADQRCVVTERKLFGVAEVKTGELESRDSFCAIASHVTAYARMYLFALIQEAGFENTYYCDTDSLIVNSTGRRRLQHRLHNTKLGWLKEEEKSKELTIVTPKQYSIGGNRKMKGIPKAAKELSYKQYVQLLRKRNKGKRVLPKEGVAYFDVEWWPSWSTLQAKGVSKGYETYYMLKVVTGKYDKGTVDAAGKVHPIVLSLDEFPKTIDAVGRVSHFSCASQPS